MEGTPVPIQKEAEWAPEPVCTVSQKNKFPCPGRDMNPGPSNPQLVAIPTATAIKLTLRKL